MPRPLNFFFSFRAEFMHRRGDGERGWEYAAQPDYVSVQGAAKHGEKEEKKKNKRNTMRYDEI